MFYELWDLETRNLLYDFENLADVDAAVDELTEVNPGLYPEKLALGRVDGEQGGPFRWIARGEALTAFLAAHRAGTTVR